MAMSRKDYEAIAASIKETVDNHRTESEQGEFLALFEMADKLADRMRRENSRFDKQRFLAACGM